MLTLEDRRIKHLYNRAGFGLDLQTWKELQAKPLKKAVQRIMKGAEINLELSAGEMEDLSRYEIRMMDKRSKQERAKENRLFIRDLNMAWFRRMAFTEAQLREKMTLFWHDHFACRLNLYKMVFLQNNTFRNYGLGKFKDLLLAVSKDPGMLSFLNNQQNKKSAPNENFARELLELFTLGRGHYTEQDIKEAARAFTGWGFNLKGGYVFRKGQHDFGRKSFKGKNGYFHGEDIIDILLEDKRCAYFLTEKLYSYFVNEKINENQVQAWADYFYDTDYDIGKLLLKIFTSDHFYQEEHIGSRIKSPAEYLVGMMRHLNMDLVKPEGFVYTQKALGQMLFQPPSVAGWPSGRSWIDSSTLMLRLRMPQLFVMANEAIDDPRQDFSGNEDVIRMRKNIRNKLETNIHWEELMETMAKAGSFEKAVDWTSDYLFSGPKPAFSSSDFKTYVKGGSQAETMKWIMVRMMCTPEYQFC
ncbi:MAG: DUF1800 domain-containing protein [Bacteroidota bacterium]